MVWYKKGVNCIELLAGGINIVGFRLECGLTQNETMIIISGYGGKISLPMVVSYLR